MGATLNLNYHLRNKMIFNFNDGGRNRAGYKGMAGDCVCRAICIVTGLPYKQVYARLAEGNATQRRGKHPKASAGVRTARDGVFVKRKWFRDYMKSLGLTWTPTMTIGSGCQVHLRADELPAGRLVVAVSKHYTTMIDGVINDTSDPSRLGERCVYGYWR